MRDAIFIEDIEAGAEIPPLVKRATNVSVFLYGVAWWTPHRIHYDKAHAQSEGFDDVIVIGGLMSAYLVKMLTAWAGDPGCLRKISTRNVAPAYAGDELTMKGYVKGKRRDGSGHLVDCDIAVEKQGGHVVISGSAVLRLPSRGS